MDSVSSYAFTYDDLVILESTLHVALMAYNSDLIQPVGRAGEAMAQDHIDWILALQKDVSEQIRSMF